MVLLQAEVFLELRKRFDPRVQFLLLARAYVSQGTGAKSWAPTHGTVCVPVNRVVRRDILNATSSALPQRVPSQHMQIHTFFRKVRSDMA